MPADGISPPLNDSAAPIGRPRHRKAPPDSGPPSPLKFPRPSASLRKSLSQIKQRNRLNPNHQPNSLKRKQRLPHPKLNPLPTGGPPPPTGVLATGADGVATIRIALPAALILRLLSANRVPSGPPVATLHLQSLKKNLQPPLNVRRARLLKIPRRFPRQAFAAATVIPASLPAFPSSK